MKSFIQKKLLKQTKPSSLLINQKSITNQQDLAKHFNNFFTFMGKNLQETIPPARKDYAQYLKIPAQVIFQ